jgi:hypothetical protein
MYGGVYLAHEPTRSRVKFGFSSDLPTRLWVINGWLKFDFLTSRYLRISLQAARRLEKELKTAFAAFKVNCDPSERFCEGSSELFHAECIYSVLEFISANRDALCEGRSVEPLPIEWRRKADEGPSSRNKFYRRREMRTPWELERLGYEG